MIKQPLVKHPADLRGFRISAVDTNYFACLADPLGEGVDFTYVVEIYEPGGKTPPNAHAIACELFFILAGSGRGIVGEQSIELGPGSTLLLPPGESHVIENTGHGKLYALCLMAPNEGFAELIHAGIPVTLDAEDLAVLTRAR